MRSIGRAAVALAVGFVLAGCGGAARDRGGFSAHDRAAVQVALNIVGVSGITHAAGQLRGEEGAPALCRIHLEKASPLKFRFFAMWTPPKQSEYGYSWLEATFLQSVGLVPSSLKLGVGGTKNEAESHYGDALTKPSEPCRIEIDGKITAVPFR
jgi:hypothetical protein